jgi:hypothetical protein
MNTAMSRLLRELITHHRVAALGTLQDGAPYVSLVPFALAADGRGLIIHVSQLAAHAQNMVRERDVSVLVAEPDGPDKLPQGLARVTIEGIAHLLEPVDPDYSAARAAYQARFPHAAGLFEFGDFSLFAIEVTSARLVGGFAQAVTVTGHEWAAAVSPR